MYASWTYFFYLPAVYVYLPSNDFSFCSSSKLPYCTSSIDVSSEWPTTHTKGLNSKVSFPLSHFSCLTSFFLLVLCLLLLILIGSKWKFSSSANWSVWKFMPKWSLDCACCFSAPITPSSQTWVSCLTMLWISLDPFAMSIVCNTSCSHSVTFSCRCCSWDPLETLLLVSNSSLIKAWFLGVSGSVTEALLLGPSGSVIEAWLIGLSGSATYNVDEFDKLLLAMLWLSSLSSLEVLSTASAELLHANVVWDLPSSKPESVEKTKLW